MVWLKLLFCAVISGLCVSTPQYDLGANTEPKCDSGEQIPKPDECNNCICYEGQIHCSHLPCHRYRQPGCKDEEPEYHPDECNICICINGIYECSDRICIEGSRCDIGQVFLQPDSCNKCKCYEGHISCTHNRVCAEAVTNDSLHTSAEISEMRPVEPLQKRQDGGYVPTLPPIEECNIGIFNTGFRAQRKQPNTDLQVYDKNISVEPFINLIQKKFEKTPTKLIHTHAFNAFQQEIKVHSKHLNKDAKMLIKALAGLPFLEHIVEKLKLMSSQDMISNNNDPTILQDNHYVDMASVSISAENVLPLQSPNSSHIHLQDSTLSTLLTSGSQSNETIVLIPSSEAIGIQSTQSLLPVTNQHATDIDALPLNPSIYQKIHQEDPHGSQSINYTFEQQSQEYFADNLPSLISSNKQYNITNIPSAFGLPGQHNINQNITQVTINSTRPSNSVAPTNFQLYNYVNEKNISPYYQGYSHPFFKPDPDKLIISDNQGKSYTKLQPNLSIYFNSQYNRPQSAFKPYFNSNQFNARHPDHDQSTITYTRPNQEHDTSKYDQENKISTQENFILKPKMPHSKSEPYSPVHYNFISPKNELASDQNRYKLDPIVSFTNYSKLKPNKIIYHPKQNMNKVNQYKPPYTQLYHLPALSKKGFFVNQVVGNRLPYISKLAENSKVLNSNEYISQKTGVFGGHGSTDELTFGTVSKRPKIPNANRYNLLHNQQILSQDDTKTRGYANRSMTDEFSNIPSDDVYSMQPRINFEQDAYNPVSNLPNAYNQTHMEDINADLHVLPIVSQFGLRPNQDLDKLPPDMIKTVNKNQNVSYLTIYPTSPDQFQTNTPRNISTIRDFHDHESEIPKEDQYKVIFERFKQDQVQNEDTTSSFKNQVYPLLKAELVKPPKIDNSDELYEILKNYTWITPQNNKLTLPDDDNGILNWLLKQNNFDSPNYKVTMAKIKQYPGKLATQETDDVTTKINDFYSKLSLPEIKPVPIVLNVSYDSVNLGSREKYPFTKYPIIDHIIEQHIPKVPKNSRYQTSPVQYPDVHIIIHLSSIGDKGDNPLTTKNYEASQINVKQEESTTVTCGEGTEWISSCHSCTCYKGQAECHKITNCVLRPLGEPMICKPYSHFKMGECYTCECNGDGIAACDDTHCKTEWVSDEKEIKDSYELEPPVFSEFYDDKKTRELLQYYKFFKKLPKDCKSQSLYPTCESGTSWISSCHTCECNDSGKHECVEIKDCELDYELHGKPGRCKPNSKFHPKSTNMHLVECTCDDEGNPYCPSADYRKH